MDASARSRSTSDAAADTRSSARFSASSARSRSISSARSAVSASTITRSPQHFEEAAAHGYNALLAVLPHHDLAGPEHRQQRRVVRQYPQLAVDAGRDDDVHVLGVDLPLHGNYLKSN